MNRKLEYICIDIYYILSRIVTGEKLTILWIISSFFFHQKVVLEKTPAYFFIFFLVDSDLLLVELEIVTHSSQKC